jgi:hypothetical protein
VACGRRPRKRLGQTRGSAKPQRGLGRQPHRPAGRFFFTEGGHTLMPILHFGFGLARVAKKSYRKCTRISCPLANAPQKRHGGRPIRPGSGGGQTRGGRWRQPLNQGQPRAPPRGISPSVKAPRKMRKQKKRVTDWLFTIASSLLF